MSNKPLTRAEWLTYLQKASDEFDWAAAYDNLYWENYEAGFQDGVKQERELWAKGYVHPELLESLEVEANMLRARNERLQKLVDSIVPRLEAACGATSMPPLVIRKLIEELS